MTPYAPAADFCQLFEREVNGLYLLAVLLTANRSLAEKCFAGGLEDSLNSNRVFRESAHLWARRMVIQNAVRMSGLRSADGNTPSSDHKGNDVTVQPAELAAIVELPDFERFVFVMSVLERYSDQGCALLLNCTRGEVIAGRIRALQQLGRWAKRAVEPQPSNAVGQARPEALEQ
jgi:DNA-directed RNA polymerase specialized sigma24 family protein